jgi:hypothetical protein
MHFYANSARANSSHALPDVKVFRLTTQEVAAQDDDLIHEYGKRSEFRLYTMDSRVRESMINAMVEEESITGGWCWWLCLPGYLPESSAFGPFDTRAEALADAQENADEFTGADEDEDEDEDA